MMEYARDELAAPLRALGGVITAIKAKKFSPDETRAVYFQEESSDSESEAESLDVDSEEEHAGLVAAEDGIALSEPKNEDRPLPLEGLARHLRRMSLHEVQDAEEQFTACGLSFCSPTLSYLNQWPLLARPLCSKCFR